MNCQFLELFWALVLTNIPPLITPIFPKISLPFPFLFPPIHTFFLPHSLSIHHSSPTHSSPISICHFRRFQPFKFAHKIPSHYYRDFLRAITHFYSLVLTLHKHRPSLVKKVNKMFTICSYCYNNFMLL